MADLTLLPAASLTEFSGDEARELVLTASLVGVVLEGAALEVVTTLDEAGWLVAANLLPLVSGVPVTACESLGVVNASVVTLDSTASDGAAAVCSVGCSFVASGAGSLCSGFSLMD